MTSNLLQVIEEKTENGRFPQPFGQDVHSHSDSFRRLKKFLEQYINNNNEVRMHAPSEITKLENYGYDRPVQHEPIEHVQSTYVP